VPEFVLTDREFELLRRFVYEQTGIALGAHKREMLKARLGRRLRALGLQTFLDYYQLLTEGDPAGQERTHFVNAVTTNVTDFFREGHHFRFLAEQWLPGLRGQAARNGDRHLRIWSAACSTGEEPYTIAMVLREALGAAAPCWDIRILASDIDTDALARATAGVYPLERLAGVDPERLRRGFLRGTGANAGLASVRPEVRDLVTFRRVNLMDDPWPVRTRFDAIFCRNVLIYFDRPTQRRLLGRLIGMLKDDGLLFLGHSESLHGMFAGMKHLENTIYQRTGASALAAGQRPATATTDPVNGGKDSCPPRS
jgi:chemotaxis protein methyltransferase CheR